MKFKQQIIDILESREILISTNVEIHQDNPKLIDRLSLLKSICTNKKVIHVGCCSHLTMIDKKIAEGKWLHGILTDISENCVGIDIEKPSLSYVHDKLGYKNVFYCNVITDPVIPQIKEKHWDYMVLGEILEHTSNPESFIRSINEKYGAYVDQIIITVPNAFSHINIAYANENIEIINTDHRYWFTPFTLAKISIDAGFEVDSFYLVDSTSKKTGWKKKIKIFPFFMHQLTAAKLKLKPLLRETLVMILNFKN